MEENTEETTPVIQDIIRVETTMMRFPLHYLGKHGAPDITIEERDSKGKIIKSWATKHFQGQTPPGPLAYKIDTLIINRRIEEAGKPTPKLICLGSLSSIAKELGLEDGGKQKQLIKNALHQNASTYIKAKFTFTARDKKQRQMEFGDTRYGIIFTGDSLPTGDPADGVYIVLHDIYRQLLDDSPTRPLDYEYLRELRPLAQRLYELLSFSIFGCLQHGKDKTVMKYSEFCTYAPQTRYFESAKVASQMRKLHLPHIESGYLTEARLQRIQETSGQPDWLIHYTAGPRAKAEYEQLTTKRLKKAEEAHAALLDLPADLPAAPGAEEAAIVPAPELNAAQQDLAETLRQQGIGPVKAARLVREHQAEVEKQLAALPYRQEISRRRNPAGWLIKAIEENYELPLVAPSGGTVGKTPDTANKRLTTAEINRDGENVRSLLADGVYTLKQIEENFGKYLHPTDWRKVLAVATKRT